MASGFAAVRLRGMSDPSVTPAAAAAEAAAHPVYAVLAAIRAVPDTLLRSLEPATLYVPSLAAPGGTSAVAAAAPATGEAAR